MIGFDRPLKPIWIYKFLRIVKVGDKISDHSEEFNKFVWQLEGTDGKRKVRTVLSRFFLKKENNSKGHFVEETDILKICKEYPLEEIKSFLFFYLFIRSYFLRNILRLIFDLYGSGEINYNFLRKKTIEKHGNREIATRTIRNLLSTLEDFDVLRKKNKNYHLNHKLMVSDMNACYMIKFYGEEYSKTSLINLDEIERYMFMYFDMPDIKSIARKYNGILWEYSIRFDKGFLLFDDHFDWNFRSP